jgi:hypothetical protein
MEMNVKNPFGYKAPNEPGLRYTLSLDRLNELFANDEAVDSVGHSADIVPEIFYGEETVRCLRISAHEREWPNEDVHIQRIAAKTRELLDQYRYVVVGTRTWGKGPSFRRMLVRVILRGPYVSRHELVPPHSTKLAAAELWRFRSGLLNYAQAKALCVHLNSFRRTTAHGVVLDWSVCEGPGPDGDLGTWLTERSLYRTQLHRSADDLSGFGIEGRLESRIASFKLSVHQRYPGYFSYLPTAPVVESMYHIQCAHEKYTLVDSSSISVTLSNRKCNVESKRREAMLEYADNVGAYPEGPQSETGLQDEHYYFLADREWTGAPLSRYEPRPHEHVATLFTATETFRVMQHLRQMGFKRIRRVQDQKAYTQYGADVYDPETGVLRCSEQSLPELGLTIRFTGLFKHESKNMANAIFCEPLERFR